MLYRRPRVRGCATVQAQSMNLSVASRVRTNFEKLYVVNLAMRDDALTRFLIFSSE